MKRGMIIFFTCIIAVLMITSTAMAAEMAAIATGEDLLIVVEKGKTSAIIVVNLTVSLGS